MTDYDQLERRAAEVEGILVHLHRDELLRLVAIAKAAEKAMNLLINMQPHIPQACYPGHAGFIDNYVDPALAALRAALSPEKERTE